MLSGFFVNSVASIEEVQQYLHDARAIHPALDFIILDEQSEARADELCRFLHRFPNDPFRDTKLIHLYTPTTDFLTGQSTFASNTPDAVRMIKPPRRARLLQMLAMLKNPGQAQVTTVGTESSDEQRALDARTLYGNVLIAEGKLQHVFCHHFNADTTFIQDNPVAQKLLVRQLERFGLNVVTTSNGEEAIAGKSPEHNYEAYNNLPTFVEWESHNPGFFSAALFDHRTSMSCPFVYIF